MRTNVKKRVCLFLFIICIVLVGISLVSLRTERAYAMENSELFLDEEVESAVKLSQIGGKGSGAILISGRNNYKEPFTELTLKDFTDVKYIPNANYFLLNPRHHVNDGSDNAGGTCTTVAVQMLLGYHNYYSDRRIIPKTGNGRTFLNEDYGNVNFDPALQRSPVNGQGCLIIGTEDGVYEEIFDRTPLAEVPYIGQTIKGVKDSAISFMTSFSLTDALKGISMTSGLFPLRLRAQT